MKIAHISEKQKQLKNCSTGLAVSVFGVIVAWVGSAGYLWMLSRPPLELKPFGALSPGMASFGSMRNVGYGFFAFGFVFLALAFVFRWRRRVLAGN